MVKRIGPRIPDTTNKRTKPRARLMEVVEKNFEAARKHHEHWVATRKHKVRF
jgi:hypothetical protein